MDGGRALKTHSVTFSPPLSEEGGWWKGTCRGTTGLIPSNYVASSIGEASNNEMRFPLHEAAKRGQVDFLRECLHQRIPLNGVDSSGSTALYWAAHGGHDDCIKEILKQGHKVQLDVQVGFWLAAWGMGLIGEVDDKRAGYFLPS